MNEKEILDLIDERIDYNKRFINKINDARCQGFNQALGAIEELDYLKDKITEKQLKI